MSERPTPVVGPPIKVAVVVELIKNSKPTVQIRVSPVRLDNRIPSLVGSWIHIRFIGRHSINA